MYVLNLLNTMDEFIFNDCSVCINPNRIERKDNNNHFEIRTAQYGGSWGVGVSWFCSIAGFSCGVSKNDCKYETETKAIRHGVEWLKRQLSKEPLKTDRLMKQLNEVLPQATQLTLF